MAWLKVSDDSGMHPMVVAPLTDPIEGLALDPYLWANTVAGVVLRCATMSAGYTTDYLISDATVMQVAGPQWRRVADAAERAGYWSRIEVGGRPGWLIVDDSDHFVHIRLKDELEWERQRKRDNSNPRLTVPVRLRDGDGCRYCGHIVDWRARRGNRMGTYDHRVPGKGATSPDDLRVACGACNAHRGDRTDADTFCPPLSPPAAPYYGKETVAFLSEAGYTVPLSTTAPSRPRSPRGTAPTTPSDPAAGRATQQPSDPETVGTSQSNTQRPGDLPDPAQRPGDLPDPAQRPGDLPDPAPATPRPSGHRALQKRSAENPQIHQATPQPSGPRAADQHEHPVAARSADPADRKGTEVGSPGRERVGSGSGREPPPPVPATGRKRSRGRRGRSSRPRPSPPAQSPRNYQHSNEQEVNLD